jgi:hypothetical protein
MLVSAGTLIISLNYFFYFLSCQDIQACFQLAGLSMTLGIALFSGLITGFILRIPIIQQIKEEEGLFEDSLFWEMPENSLEEKQAPTEIMNTKHVIQQIQED